MDPLRLFFYQALKRILRTPREQLDVAEVVEEYLPQLEAALLEHQLYTEAQVADRFPALDVGMLRGMRVKGIGPDYIKAGPHRNSRIFYRACDLHLWMERQRVRLNPPCA